MPACENKFWLEKISELFCEIDIIPLSSMDLNGQLNAITRLILLLSIIFAPVCGPYIFIFLLLGLIFVIILFYTLRNMNCSEKYVLLEEYTPKNRTNKKSGHTVTYCNSKQTVAKCTKNTRNPHRISNFKPQNQYNENYISRNQKLAGKPALRTLVAPVSVAPVVSSEWKENSLVVRPGINSETNYDLSRSGYVLSAEARNCHLDQGDKDMNMELARSTWVNKKSSHVVENMTNPVHSMISEGGDVLVNNYHNTSQIFDSNLPSNLNVGRCQHDPVFNEYNKQVNTSMIQPGVYSRNQIIEPISSNIGISFTQQFEPISIEKDKNGITFVGHDPSTVPFEKKEELIPYDKQVHLNEIYDPRHTGYGTSYRSYVEPVTGQVRFYYDDVDAHKRPNYICKSNVDFLPSSLSTQAIPNDNYFNTQNKYARSIANDSFMDNTLAFRTEMQQRLIRKANAIKEQQRRFPKHTQRMARGSMMNPRG